jgi:hypothetical protein
MERLKEEALKVIAQLPELQLKFDPLLSIAGIAETSALRTLWRG